MACPLCRQRKGKRFCPAKREKICAHCCGTKRRVEIDCPEDCVYLTGAHASGWEGRETERERDLRRVAPFVQGLSEPQAQLFFVAFVGLVALRARHRELDDRLLGEALGAFRKTVETRRRGVLYEHPPEDPRAQAVLDDVARMFESRDAEGGKVTPADADLLAVLTALGGALDLVRRDGASGTAFLDTAARIAARMGGVPRPAGAHQLIVEP